MTPESWGLLALFLGITFLCVKPLGLYIARVMDGARIWPLRAGGGIERLIYRFCAIDPAVEMGWKRYAAALLGFIEFAFVDEINHGVGVVGQLVCDIVHEIAAVLAVVMAVVMIVGVPCRLGGASLGRRFEGGACGFFILRQAAALVFLPTATRAGIITSDLGHDSGEGGDVSEGIERCGILPAIAACGSGYGHHRAEAALPGVRCGAARRALCAQASRCAGRGRGGLSQALQLLLCEPGVS